MAYKNNHFCWYGVISTDTTAASTFYGTALAVDVTTGEMDGNPMVMLGSGGVPFAHLTAPQMEDVASHWESYLRVEDVDALSAAAVANGGSLVMPGMDIPPGRFSVVASPSGATFCLFHEADEAVSTNHPGDTAGSVHWTELWSKDVDADVAWLTKTFGLTSEVMPMPEGPYHVLKAGDEMVGGVMASKEDKAPSMWLTWLQVDDVDATVASIGVNGGNTLSPVMDVPMIGRMAVVADPTGGVFGVITPPARA